MARPQRGAGTPDPAVLKVNGLHPEHSGKTLKGLSREVT